MDMAKKTGKRGPKRQRQAKNRQTRRRRKSKPRRRLIPRYDPRLELALKQMRAGDSLAEAARKVGVMPAQLRIYARASGIAWRKNGKWRFKRDRRFRRMPLFSDGRRVIVTVHNGRTASFIGAYMRAVRLFFETEDEHHLDRFRNQSVPDVTGKRHVLETRPNMLLRLDAAGVEPFDLAYEIVKKE